MERGPDPHHALDRPSGEPTDLPQELFRVLVIGSGDLVCLGLDRPVFQDGDCDLIHVDVPPSLSDGDGGGSLSSTPSHNGDNGSTSGIR